GTSLGTNHGARTRGARFRATHGAGCLGFAPSAHHRVRIYIHHWEHEHECAVVPRLHPNRSEICTHRCAEPWALRDVFLSWAASVRECTCICEGRPHGPRG